MEQIYHISEQCEVELSIDHKRMQITVEGTIEEMDKAKDKIFELVKTLQKKNFMNEMVKQIAERVQWEGMVCKFHLMFFPHHLFLLIYRG